MAEMTEELVCRLWQRLYLIDASRLRTKTGERVHVLFGGWRSADAGPDFRDGIIQIGDGPLRYGDVEIHTRTSGWRDHGHQRDPRYNGLALHVVWEDDGHISLTRDGAAVPTVALRDALHQPFERVRDTVLAAGALPAQGQFVCPGVAAGTTDVELRARLRTLGEARLDERATALEGDMSVSSPEQVWYESIFTGLGYRKNSGTSRLVGQVIPFATLAHLLEGRRQEQLVEAEGVLLGAAGLLPRQRARQRAVDATTASYVDLATAAWARHANRRSREPLVWEQWTWTGIRPANLPARRIASEASLVAPVVARGFGAWLSDVLDAPDGRRLVRPLNAPERYWSSYFDFGWKATPSPQALVGQRRMTELAVNATLPCAVAFARTHGDDALAARARAIFGSLPACGDNQLSRQMLAQLEVGDRAPASAAEEQGLLHVYHRWCRWKRCWECGLRR